MTWFEEPWAALLLVLVALAMFMTYGGFRTSVTAKDITVRFGLPGLKVLRLNTSEVAAVELNTFRPLHDFGGYGIRVNREMTAYFLRGPRGVKLTTLKGKKYLIGSDRPEELYAVIQAVVKNR